MFSIASLLRDGLMGKDHVRRLGMLDRMPELEYTGASFTVSIAIAGHVHVANRATAITGNLPAVASTKTESYFFRNIGVGDLTLDPNAAETIEGAASIVLKTGDAAEVWPNGAKTAWRAAITMSVANLAAALPKTSPLPGGRVSLSSTLPVTESDLAGQTAVHYVPTLGKYVPIFDGSTGFVAKELTGPLSLTLDSDSGHTGYQQANKNFDFFIEDTSGTARLVTGPTWDAGAVAGSDVARGTGAGSSELELFEGLLVNKNTITGRFGNGAGNTVSIPARRGLAVGSFRPTANGQATDTARQRRLFNFYNQQERSLKRAETDEDWPAPSSVYRQANSNTDNEVQVLLGLAGVMVRASLAALAFRDTRTPIIVGIGIDSTTVISQDSVGGQVYVQANDTMSALAAYCGYPGLGYHRLVWIEWCNSSALTFFGVNAGFGLGIRGGFNG